MDNKDDKLQDEIKLLKAKYKWLINVEVKGKGAFILRKPNRSELAAFLAISKQDQLEAVRVLIASCTVYGNNTEMLEEADVLFSLQPTVDSLVEIYDVEVKNL